nr:MAG TPA: Heterocyst differentiation control protein [Caudoviricetes sp.]
MLVKNENEWCWCLGEYVGYPQKSIEDAVKDFADTYPAEEVPMIRVGNPYYYIPTVDADHVIEDVVEYDLDDEIAEYSEDYLLSVKQEHIDELQEELTAVFRKWEKRYGYNNTSFVVFETINPFE